MKKIIPSTEITDVEREKYCDVFGIFGHTTETKQLKHTKNMFKHGEMCMMNAWCLL